MTTKEQIIDLFRQNVKGNRPNVDGKMNAMTEERGIGQNSNLELQQMLTMKQIYGDMN